VARDPGPGREEPRRPLHGGAGEAELTTTYDPTHPQYFDEADVRDELTRVFDLCHGCRLCFNLCPAFPTLFDFVDAHDGEAAAMGTAEQDQVVDECYQCKLCYVKCPYVPPHEWELDFPRLIMRAKAVRKKHHSTFRGRATDQALGRTDLVGRINSAMAPLANKVVRSPGSFPRRMMERALGISSERLLPPYVRERFTTWFRKRSAPVIESPQARVAVFPTCMVEYQGTQVGRDLVHVYERNRIDCSVTAGAGCCGAPFLHSGDIANFKKQAERNVEAMAAAVREGRDVVVPQPTCGYTLKRDYPVYLQSEDAELVASHTFDASEYLTDLAKQDGKELDTEFGGEVPESIAYHAPCHLRAQNIGLRSRDLLKLTGAQVTVATKCSGIDGTWGYRQEHYAMSKEVGAKLAREIEKADAQVVAGDCHLANGGIEEDIGRAVVHPLSVIARAYGIPAEDG
jgi:Fe-S oxidoreductase